MITLTQALAVGCAVLFLFLLIAGAVAYSVIHKLGVSEEARRRLVDVVKGAEIAARKAVTVLDWATKEKFNFYEDAKNARTANDWIKLSNRMLQINAEHVEPPDPKRDFKPQL